MATHDKYLGWSDGNQTLGIQGFDGLTVAGKGWGRRGSYRASQAVEVAEVGLVVPGCHAGCHLPRIGEANALAAHPGLFGLIRWSGHQWTSHSRNSRHLCPVVVLDILFCFFIPPSFLWSYLPPSLSAVWHHHAAVSTSIKEPLGRTVCLSVCAFERSVNMEHVECCNPPAPCIQCSPLPTDAWFIRPILNSAHTRTHPHHPTLRRVYPTAPCCACSVWRCA